MFYLLCLLSQLYTMGSRSVFNISHPMQECEHMGYLSKLIDSAIIINEMRKNASVFHNDVFHILFVSWQNDVENVFRPRMHIIHERKGTCRAECRRVMVKSLSDSEIRDSHHQL